MRTEIITGHVRITIAGSIGDDIDGTDVLLADGSVVAIGARSNDGNGDGSGHAALSDNNGSCTSC